MTHHTKPCGAPPGTITVGAATGGSLIDMTGTGGSRVITGVGAGSKSRPGTYKDNKASRLA